MKTANEQNGWDRLLNVELPADEVFRGRSHRSQSAHLYECTSDKARTIQRSHRWSQRTSYSNTMFRKEQEERLNVSYWRWWRFPTFTFEDTMKRMKVGTAGISKTNGPGYVSLDRETNEHEPTSKITKARRAFLDRSSKHHTVSGSRRFFSFF